MNQILSKSEEMFCKIAAILATLGKQETVCSGGEGGVVAGRSGRQFPDHPACGGMLLCLGIFIRTSVVSFSRVLQL